MSRLRKTICLTLVVLVVAALGGVDFFSASANFIAGIYNAPLSQGTGHSVTFAVSPVSAEEEDSDDVYGTDEEEDDDTSSDIDTSTGSDSPIDIYGTGDVTYEILTFDDANLEKAIRNKLDLPEGEILSIDVEDVTKLDLSGQKISNIDPLANFTSLTELNLSKNSLTSITPLLKLDKLTSLNLSTNKLTGISGIEALTNLKYLNLASNSITSISPLSKLTRLTSLFLKNNKVKDYSPVAEYYKNLKEKDFTYTAPIVIKVNSKALYLAFNPITDSGYITAQAELFIKGLGASYKYDTKTSSITAVKGKTTIVMKINSKTATVNSKSVSMPVAAKKNTVPFVPVKFVAETFGYKYSYDSNTKIVTLKA